MDSQRFRRTINRIGNPVVTTILRSPFHRLLSGGVMLITVRGRKTGKEDTTPIQYRRSDGGFLVTSRRGRTWWRNVEGGAPVELLVQGRRLHARAEVEELRGERQSLPEQQLVSIRITLQGGRPAGDADTRG